MGSNASDTKTRRLTFSAEQGSAGFMTQPAETWTPDNRGVILTYEVEVPPFAAASYFAPYQKYDPIPGHTQSWPDGCNRIQPLAITNFADLAVGGHFLLLQLHNGRYLAVLAAVGKRTFAWFAGEDGKLLLAVGTLGTTKVEGIEIPLCAWAEDQDPYGACRRVWETAAADNRLNGSTRLREEKSYPEPFRYLGWCTWEEYKFDIDGTMLQQAFDRIEASGLPIRYVLVDDGHLHADARRRLISFRPDADKFPEGWEGLLARRSKDGIRWMGLWLNFNGYWGGISPDNELGELNRHLEPVASGALQPKNAFADSLAFYEAMIGSVREAGFDFIKVDNQAKNVEMNSGMDNGTERAAHNAQALETASARHMKGLINCMAHNAVCAFNTRLSAVTRCSEDYAVGDLGRARRHLHNSYGNMPWLGQTVWGDHDMFHSGDKDSGQMMAISKAMSGGPVYLSDNPASFDAANVLPLCYGNGELLRPLAPAAPIRECLFDNPLEGASPYVVSAPLAGGAVAIVAYNLSEPEVPLKGSIRPAHYADAGNLLSDRGEWTVPGEGLVLFDWLAQRAVRLEAPFAFDLPGYGNRLFQLTPIREGWSAIGRTDKFLSAAAVETISATERELIVRLRESGPFAIWSGAGRPETEAAEAIEIGDGFWRFDLPAGQTDLAVRIRRQ
ncbi:Sip1-related alpha-galactosidase [Paenibacillus hodogayensis]|uniref:Sip1-related alpha-galactosidase n=1 Tax=Paenibacillus hodogayensis TaxID=279208 RepID=A0ABV5VX58_9BACL